MVIEHVNGKLKMYEHNDLTLALNDRPISYIKSMNIKGKRLIKRSDSQIIQEVLDTAAYRNIKTATIIITYFDIVIALEYHTGWYAPIITLKEKGIFAFTIINMAKESNTPIVEDKSLARDLYLNTKSKYYLPEEFYEAVAFFYKKQKYSCANRLYSNRYVKNNHINIKTLPLIEVAKYLDIKVEESKK